MNRYRFFTNISHEFRTPLTLILGPAKQLLERSNDDMTKTEAQEIYKIIKLINENALGHILNSSFVSKEKQNLQNYI